MAQATRQHGVISTAELRRFGLTEKAIRWRVETGILQPLFVGVFLVAGSPRTWEQRITAAVRWGGDGAVASYKSAAALWRFDGFEPGPLEISTLKQNRQRLGFKVHRTLVEPVFITTKAGIPVTNPFRTLQDVVAVVDEHRGNQLFDELLRKGLVSMESLQRYADREECSGNKGVGKLRRMVRQRSPAYQPSASEFQALVRRLLAGAGFAFVEEFVVVDSDGTFIGRADFKLLDVPVLVEAEGRANHSSKEDFEHDLKRRNGFTAAGFATVHVTWTMALNDPEVFLAEVERARESQLRRRA
jgi:very-short-patch-repair endonuclease